MFVRESNNAGAEGQVLHLTRTRGGLAVRLLKAVEPWCKNRHLLAMALEGEAQLSFGGLTHAIGAGKVMQIRKCAGCDT